MSKPPRVSKRARGLLKSQFMRDGKVAWSGTDTSDGSLVDWLELERRGLVKRMRPSGKGILGHSYGYNLTDAGQRLLETA